MPVSKPPPVGRPSSDRSSDSDPSSVAWCSLAACFSNRHAHQSPACSVAIGNSNNELVESRVANWLVSRDPVIAPAVPPAAIVPNRRLPWLLENRSAKTDQNTLVANSAKTLTQTKKTRADQVCSQDTSDRMASRN